MPVGPKCHLIHSHKQEVDGVLAAHSHRPEDRDLKVLAKARECSYHQKREEAGTICPLESLEAARAWGHLDFVSHHHSKHDIISLERNRISWLPEWGSQSLTGWWARHEDACHSRDGRAICSHGNQRSQENKG